MLRRLAWTATIQRRSLLRIQPQSQLACSGKGRQRLRPPRADTKTSIANLRFVSSQNDSSTATEYSEEILLAEDELPVLDEQAIKDQLLETSLQRHDGLPAFVVPNLDETRQLIDSVFRITPIAGWASMNKAFAKLADKKKQINIKSALNFRPVIPDWATQNFKTLHVKRNQGNRKMLGPPDPFLENKTLEHTIDLVMAARHISTQRPLLWSRTKRTKLRRDYVIRDSKEDHPTPKLPQDDDDNDVPDINLEHDNESPIWKEQRERISELCKDKSLEQNRTEAQALIRHLTNNLTHKQFQKVLQLFTVMTLPFKVQMNVVEPHLRECCADLTRIQQEIARFFYMELDCNTEETDHSELPEPDSCVDLTNEEAFNKYVSIVSKFRNIVVKCDCIWNMPDDLQDEEQTLAFWTNHAEQLKHARAVHAKKRKKALQMEAEEMVRYLAMHLTATEFIDLLQRFKKYSSLTKSKKTVIRFLDSHLITATTTHVHLVAKEIAEFFYMEVDDHFVSRHEPLREAKEIFDSSKEAAITSFYSFQMRCLQDDTVRQVDELNDDVSQALPTTIVNNAYVRVRHYHVVMDAVLTTKENLVVPGSERTMIVDNLPIDITEDAIRTFYGRCGSIESVLILNQRSDLDPGPLTASEIKERIKSSRTNLLYTQSSQWERPKTPVYAIITFETDEGYKAGTDPNLCLFGMIIEKQAVRSFRASDMKKLFIDHIPLSYTARDLEYEINKVLNPMVHVYLDLGANAHRYGTICEIVFPSFDVAYLSQKMLMSHLNLSKITEKESAGDLDPVVINFWKNPRDAKKYYTRELIFH